MDSPAGIGAAPSARAWPRTARWEWLLIVLVTAGGAWLRWRQIGEQGVWLDEAFSIWMARQPLIEMLGWLTRIDQHPPAYYALLHAWLPLGASEATIRSLSALLGTATIPTLWLTGRRLFGPVPGLAAGILLAVSPFNIRFAQEMRMYTLLAFSASVALLALAHLLTGNTRFRWWALYAFFTALAMLSHNAALLFFVAVNCGVLGLWLVLRLRRQARATLSLPRGRDWLLGQIAVLLLWSPWSVEFVCQARLVDAEFWIQPPTRATIAAALGAFASDGLPVDNAWLWSAAAAVLLLGILGAWRRAGAATLLLLLVAIPFAAELILSLRRPIFYDRTLIWTTLPLYLIAGASLSGLHLTAADRLRLWAGRALAAAGSLALGLLLYANYLSLLNFYDNYRKEEWREAAAWAAERVRPQDLILFNATWVQIPFDYYFAPTTVEAIRHGVPVDLFDAGVLEPIMTEADLQRMRDLIAPHNCVWLVYSHNWYTDPQNLIPTTLRRELMVRKTQPFAGLVVHLYERRGGSEDCVKRP